MGTTKRSWDLSTKGRTERLKLARDHCMMLKNGIITLRVFITYLRDLAEDMTDDVLEYRNILNHVAYLLPYYKSPITTYAYKWIFMDPIIDARGQLNHNQHLALVLHQKNLDLILFLIGHVGASFDISANYDGYLHEVHEEWINRINSYGYLFDSMYQSKECVNGIVKYTL